MSWRRALAVACAALLGVTACAGGESGPRPITSDEADRLSEVLFANYDSEGAHFVLTAMPELGAQVRLEGRIDFVEHLGYATVDSTGADAAVEAVVFSESTVVERIPAFDESVSVVAGGTQVWVSRPANPELFQIDSLLAVVVGLAGQQRENPLLLEQGGVRWVGEDVTRGVEVDVFEYSPQVRLWVEKDSSLLMRFEGNSSTLDRPIVIDLYDRGPVEVPTLDGAEVVAAEDLGELYDAVRWSTP